ncbi:MAG: hypothetical protein JXR77_15500 [Lentisphaeria bacterium]|nr:hypothetical protein [Lentisphaeria bacterium]
MEAGMLTSKERVMRALGHREPDRVPLNYHANPGIDRRLKEHFGLDPRDGEGLLQALGVDFRGVHAPYRGPRLHPEVPGVNVDPVWGCRRRWIEHGCGGYWEEVEFPLREADADTVAAWPMPSPDDYDCGAVLAQCERHAERALHVGGAGTGDIINRLGRVRGMEQALVDLITADPAGMLWVDRMLAIELEVLSRTLDVAAKRVDFVWMGEDLGTQRGPIIGLDLYRSQIRPRHQRFVDLAKSHGLPVMIHSCGSSSWAFPDFLEMGINAVDTLQPEAKDMAPAYLKATFGDRLAFHGCISTGGAVAFGTVADVEREVRNTLDIMMPGGGYCLSPTHMLQDNSPTENVLALYDCAKRYGQYA